MVKSRLCAKIRQGRLMPFVKLIMCGTSQNVILRMSVGFVEIGL